MDDEAENIRKQIRFLSGLIENANKSRNNQETRKPQFPGRFANTSGSSLLHQSGKSRPSHQSKNDRETSSKYSWKKYHSVPVSHASGITDIIGKGKAENKVCGKTNSIAAYHLQKTSSHIIPDSVAQADIAKSKMLFKSKAVTYPFHTSQGILESNKPDIAVDKLKLVTGNLESTVQSISVMKKESTMGKSETNPAAITVNQAIPKPIQGRPVKTTASTTSVGKVDEKLKTLSNSLKDELKKTEEQINLLKQNLTEQKSLLKLKQQLKEPKSPDAVKQRIVEQTPNILSSQDQLHVINISPLKQIKSNTPSPIRSPITMIHVNASPLRQVKSDSPSPVGAPITKTSSQDTFISKSPYKLVKCNTSPVVSAAACQKLNLHEHVQNNAQTKKVKTKYKVQNVKSVTRNKALVKNEIGSGLGGISNASNPVFKKTKYTLRRIKSEPGNTQKREKAPTKFLKSRYSLKRVRRSLSNKSNEDVVGKSRFSVVNTPKSNSQYVARSIKSKYKVNNIATPKTFKWKQHFKEVVYSQVYDPYGKRPWKPRLNPHTFGRNRTFYHMPKNKWISRQRYRGNSGWPLQYFKVSRYMPPTYSVNGRFNHTTRFSRYSRQKRLNELKKTIPFNPKLRTDHRQKKGEKLKMIHGVVYRSTQRILVKANHSGAGSSNLAKHRQLTKNPMTFIRNIGSQAESSTVHNHETKHGAVVQQSSLKTRLVATQLMNKSIALATAKYKKDNTKSPRKKKYCMFYNRFGKCNRKDNCPFIHDPERIAICTRFLRGTCKVKDCPFSHKVSKEKMPVCSYFLRGKCNRDDCPYLHVNVNRDAEICEDFVNGYCPLGDQCKKKHTLVCPVFSQTGSCPNGNKCKLQHRKTKKRKVTQSDDTEPVGKQMKPLISSACDNSSAPSTSHNSVCDTTTTAASNLLKSWTRITPAVGGEKAPLVLDSSDEESDDLQVPFKDRKLPTYIPLTVKDKVKDNGAESGLEKAKDQEEAPTMKIRPHL